MIGLVESKNLRMHVTPVWKLCKLHIEVDISAINLCIQFGKLNN